MSWPRKKLELLASDEPYSFVGGPFGSKLTSRDYVEDGVPVIRGSNLNNGRFLDMDDFVFVSDSKVRKDLSSNLAKPCDLVFTQRGTLGQVALIPEEGISDRYVVSQSQMKLTIDNSKADRLFLYYYFSSREAVERIMNFTSSSGVPHINLTVLRNFKVPVPPLETQHVIASILSAYDDLIENNRRRIQLLEQAAQLLYKEWFVHLRFPGHEHVKIKDGVPDGWGKKSFSELATFLNGFAFKPAHLGDVGLPIVKIPELRDGPTVKTPRNTGEHIPEKYLLNNGDILFSWSATLLVNIWNHGKGLLNQHLFKVTPVSANLYGLVYFALKQALVEFQNQTTGATMKHIRKGALEKVAPLIPNAVLLDEFEVTVAPMLEQISVLQRQTTDAVEARDLLLPRLMNGEVAV